MKKLIALLLAVAFVCASAVGCGDTKPTGAGGGTGGAKPSGASGGASGGAKP